jgi:[acyl-carrier-protein] S-malonyltransferase
MSLALLFSGQGLPFEDMFESVRYRAEIATLLARLTAILGCDPISVPPDKATLNAVAQPRIVAHALAQFQLLKPLLPEIQMVLGYSLGAVSAASAAGAIAAEDAISLASERARLMDAASPIDAGMLAVRGISRAQADDICEMTNCEIAIHNGRDHLVLGGRGRDLDAAQIAALQTGARTARRLQVSVCSHISRMISAAAPFRKLLDEKLCKNVLQTPVVACSRPSLLYNGNELAEELAVQLYQPLKFAESLEFATESGARVFLEVGMGRALTQIAGELLPAIPARAMDDFGSIQGAAMWVRRQLDSI